MRAAGPTHALGAGPDSELDPASKLDLVARGPDFSKEKHTTGSSVATGPVIPRFPTDFYLPAG